jgi:uncharacterized membrane protein YuzA (DUF378 family)
MSATQRRLNAHTNVIALTLLIIGGVNWGLVGLLDLDSVAATFGAGTTLARVVYGIVGLSALYSLPIIFDPGHRLA